MSLYKHAYLYFLCFSNQFITQCCLHKIHKANSYFLFNTRSQHYKENPIYSTYLFLEKELRGLSPNFHMHIYFIICTVILSIYMLVLY